MIRQVDLYYLNSMKVVNLLEFLNSSRQLYTPDYDRCNREMINFLDLLAEDEQFTRCIDLGIIYLNQTGTNQYIIVDGLNRIASLSILLHAICECYKKTTAQNEKAIKTIRSKYLMSAKKTKLIFSEKENEIYTKIINGERLSGAEKTKPLFQLLHKLWSQIKEDKLQAAKIFKMLQKINVTIVETDEVIKRDLYYHLNKNIRDIDQILLIEDYLKSYKLTNEWSNISKIYKNNKKDLTLFFTDFLVTKFNYKIFPADKLYECFVNYFETMCEYMPAQKVIEKIEKSALLYFNIINIDFNNNNIQKAFINIKKHAGEDTYGYILNVYEDFSENKISESIFVEILNTIDEYLKNRLNNGNNVNFNELINYLNAFIACK